MINPDSPYVFGPQFFEQHQEKLLRLANNPIGRWILRIHGKRSSVGKNRITKILPNAIFWDGEKEGQVVAEFRVKNKFSNRIYYAFYPIWFLMHGWDINVANPLRDLLIPISPVVPNWNLGFDTLTVYPDPVPTYSDDSIYFYDPTYLTARNAATGTRRGGISMYVQATWTSPNYFIEGLFINWDTSDLGASAVISAATASPWVIAKTVTDASFNARLYNSTASNPLIDGDFDQRGSTEQSNTNFSTSTVTTGAYNDYPLNATGISNISLTGITKFCLRDQFYDTASNVPTGTNYFEVATSRTAGTTNDPKL